MKAVYVWAALSAGLLLAAMFAKTTVTQGYLMSGFLLLVSLGLIRQICKR